MEAKWSYTPFPAAAKLSLVKENWHGDWRADWGYGISAREDYISSSSALDQLHWLRMLWISDVGGPLTTNIQEASLTVLFELFRCSWSQQVEARK